MQVSPASRSVPQVRASDGAAVAGFRRPRCRTGVCYDWPRIGSLYLALFAAGIVAVLVAHLVRGRRAALEAEVADGGARPRRTDHPPAENPA